MFSVRKRKVVNPNFCILESLVTLTALRMGGLYRFRQRNGLFGMARGAGGFFPTMTFKTGFFGRTKSRRVMGIMINIVVTGSAGVLQLLNMEPVRNRDIIGIDLGGSAFYIINTRMATNTVRIDLVQFSREASMFPITLERKNIDARHQGMTRCMALRAVNLGMQGGLFPKGRFPLLMVTGDTEFLLGRGIGGEGDGCVESHNRQDSP
jgi:hypothetical protein